MPSLLRGFSAPVILDDGLHDADLLVLLAHDSDPFNRWEAGQRLALQPPCSRRCTAATPAAALDADFVDAMRAVLRHPALDPAFKELVLTLPSESYVAEQLDVGRPAAHPRGARGDARQLAQRAARRLGSGRSRRTRCSGGYSPDPVASGRRALANLALRDAVPATRRRAATGVAGPRLPALQGRRQHDRPPGRAGARWSIARPSWPTPRSSASTRMFSDEPLVVDKWFALQADAPEQRRPRVRARQAADAATRTSR